MRIVHISTNDIRGGAARAAFRLHQGLTANGQTSSMFVSSKSSQDSRVTVFRPPSDVISRVRRRFKFEQMKRSARQSQVSLPAGYESLSMGRSRHNGADVLTQLPPCDVINLHWIANFIDYQTFFTSLPPSLPVVWTLHDMNAFTGGCHYDLGCGAYTNYCGACPQLGSNDSKDRSNQAWDRKKIIFSKLSDKQLHIVTPSHWLAAEARRSVFNGQFPISVIPNGLDLEDFAPRGREFARGLLGVSQKAKVVLFVADSLTVHRKGFGPLTEALGLVGQKVKDLFLISIGNRDLSIDIKIPWLHLGHLSNDRFLSVVYSAADLFVVPSIQDNLPNTVLESLACGTPIVGFATGGIPDMVRHGITGALAPTQNVAALGSAIADLLEDVTERTEMAENCRRVAIDEYALEVQARAYAKLYETVSMNAKTE